MPHPTHSCAACGATTRLQIDVRGNAGSEAPWYGNSWSFCNGACLRSWIDVWFPLDAAAKSALAWQFKVQGVQPVPAGGWVGAPPAGVEGGA